MKSKLKYVILAILNVNLLLICCVTQSYAQTSEVQIDEFNNLEISPYIGAILVEGSSPSVEILSSNIPEEKLKIKSSGKTLKLYISGSKNLNKNNDDRSNGGEINVQVKITYTSLKRIKHKGDEKLVFESDFDSEELKLIGYGNGAIIFKSINVDELTGKLHGNFVVSAEKGLIEYQNFVMYGNSEISFGTVKNEVTKLSMYGNTEVDVNVSKLLKTSGFGNFVVKYKGNPELKRGLVLGNGEVSRLNE